MNTVGILLRQRLRRDRWQLAAWVLGVGLLALFAAAAIAQTFGNDADRAQILALAIATPAILMLRGLPEGSPVGAFTYFSVFAFLALLATLIHGAIANILMALAVTVGFIIGKLDAGGSLCAGVAVGAVGLSFLGVGLVAAQFMRTSRGANGTAAALVVAAYIVRGIGDAASTAGSDPLHRVAGWPSWLSPIGWGQQTGAFVRNNYAPLAINVSFAAACAAAVFALQARRDTGASMLPVRAGRADARASLRTSLALGWRLQWPSIAGWSAAGAATGLLAGSLANILQAAGGGNTSLLNAVRSIVPGTTQTPTQLIIAAMFSVVGVLAAACATQAVIRLRQEEVRGTAEAVLAAPVHRVRWFADYLVLGLVAVVLVLLAAGVASAASGLAAGAGGTVVGDSFAAAAAQLPAALVYLAVVSLLFVLVPEATVAAGWGLLVLGMILGIYGGMVGLPQWARNISPFQHTPVPFGVNTQWAGGIWMLVIAAVVVAAATLLMGRRPLHSG
ncbi:hypothetical protein [Specibacter cremeus]|uniref:hypothetical protein n=1 Tax=Specibacter cremeus TaxID=1629051 RepID=UPI000F7AB425|nr:hypothetical protein [Specibacter cremeus]